MVSDSFNLVHVEEYERNSDVVLALLEGAGDYYIGFGSGDRTDLIEDVMRLETFLEGVGEEDNYESIIDQSCVYCKDGSSVYTHPELIDFFACPDCHSVVKDQFESIIKSNSHLIVGEKI